MSSGNHCEMEHEWRSWEHLIREDIRRLDFRLRQAQEMMMRFQPSTVVERYVVERLSEIIREECST